MDLRHVRSAVATAEMGGLRAAAERIYLSPAAVHKHVRLLEETLDVQLFERAGRALRPTQALETLLPHFKTLLADHESTTQAVEELKGRKRGFVRIASGPAASAYLLPPLIERFHNTFPGIALHLETGPPAVMVDRLSNGAVDAVMLMGAYPESPRVVEAAVWQTSLVLVTALPKVPARCTLAALARQPFVLYQQGSTTDNLISAYFAETGFRPRVVMRCESTETIKAMVRRRLGVAMLPLWCISEDLEAGSIRLIRQKERTLFSNVTLLARRASFVPHAVEALLEMARVFPWRFLEPARAPSAR